MLIMTKSFVYYPQAKVQVKVVVIGGEVIPEEVFLKAEPKFNLPEGVEGVEYVPGSHLYHLIDGILQPQAEIKWKEGDKYISKASDYKDLIPKPDYLVEMEKAVAKEKARIEAILDVETAPSQAAE